jgi:hypothetical protein
MPVRTRQLYESPNGDRWLLARDADGDRVFVRHEANPSSGGHVTDTEIGAFLGRGGTPPEQQALLRLIASLVEQPAEADARSAASTPRH